MDWRSAVMTGLQLRWNMRQQPAIQSRSATSNCCICPSTALCIRPLQACTMMFKRESSLPPGWRYELYSPFSPYALSSLCIVVLGIQLKCQHIWCPDAAPGWPTFPHSAAEATWVILQGRREHSTAASCASSSCSRSCPSRYTHWAGPVAINPRLAGRTRRVCTWFYRYGWWGSCRWLSHCWFRCSRVHWH